MERLEIQIKTGIHAGDSFKVKFNPEEYTLNQDNNFAVQGIPGLSAPLIQYVHGNLRTLEMELLLDTWDTNAFPGSKQDVRDLTNQIVSLMEIDPDLHAPAILNLSWSSLQFQCVLARVSQKFTMFAEDGKPVRARLTCTFNEIIDSEQEAKQVSRRTADFSKVYVVAQGDTLSGIAGRLYNNPQLWRPLAIMNEVTDPRSIVPGQTLHIPALPCIDPDSGEVIT